MKQHCRHAALFKRSYAAGRVLGAHVQRLFSLQFPKSHRNAPNSHPITPRRVIEWLSQGDWILVSVAGVSLVLEAWLVAEVVVRLCARESQHAIGG